MGSVDLGGGGKSRKKGKGIKKPKRVGFRLDMTPLVDVAFLLLTFFMFATTMSQPTIMEVSTPPDVESDIEVKASELLTLYLRSDGRLFYANGTEPDKYLAIDPNKVVDFAVRRNSEMDNRLITILKVDPDVQYATVVTILDKLNLAEGELTDKYAKKNVKRERRFSILPIEPEVKTALDQITT